MADRLMLWQAQAQHPSATFAPLRSGLVHAITENYAPTLLCRTACGRLGYAEASVVQVDEAEQVCMQCMGALGRCTHG